MEELLALLLWVALALLGWASGGARRRGGRRPRRPPAPAPGTRGGGPSPAPATAGGTATLAPPAMPEPPEARGPDRPLPAPDRSGAAAGAGATVTDGTLASWRWAVAMAEALAPPRALRPYRPPGPGGRRVL